MTLTEAIGPDLLKQTNWRERLGWSDMRSFGSADGTFGDVVSATRNAAIDSMGFSVCLWAYGILLNDTRTPPAVLQRLLPALTDRFVIVLRTVPLDAQPIGDLVGFMDNYSRARGSGRFDREGILHIGRVMQNMADNVAAKGRSG